MKLTGIISTILYLQASASFLGDFRNAISNVDHGFGKLLTGVVTDVKDTIHCTISAVEHVLMLNGLLDKTSSYNYRCSDISKLIEPKILTPSITRDQRNIFDRINSIRYPNRVLDHRQSPRHVSIELVKSIANVNKTINDILRYPQGNINFQIASQTMKNETNRLTEISEILKRELENISSNIHFEIKKLHLARHKLNDESVWEQFKTLYDLQKTSKNSTEVSEIRKVLDNFVDNLRLNSDTTKVLGNYDLKEIRKKLLKYSDSDDKLKKVEDSDTYPRPQALSLNKSETNIGPKTFKDLTKKILNDKKNVDDDQSAVGKSLFGVDRDTFKYLTPFSNVKTNDKKVLSDAKEIIEESLHTDKILNNFFNEHRSDTNVFSNPEMFNF